MYPVQKCHQWGPSRSSVLLGLPLPVFSDAEVFKIQIMHPARLRRTAVNQRNRDLLLYRLRHTPDGIRIYRLTVLAWWCLDDHWITVWLSHKQQSALRQFSTSVHRGSIRCFPRLISMMSNPSTSALFKSISVVSPQFSRE
jgi:hypothetical protein